MARTRRAIDTPSCPFIDADDPRCARHFSLGRMDEAFDLCFNHFNHCATYYQVRAEQQAAVQLSVFGRPLAGAGAA